MSGIGQVAIYSNMVALMLTLGIMALMLKFPMSDKTEKQIFMALLAVLVAMSVFYIIDQYAQEGLIKCGIFGALLITTVLEMLINCFAIQWFMYVDYRIFRSVNHIKRNGLLFSGAFIVLMLLDLINVFTHILYYYKDDLTYVETPFYIITDLIRLVYFFVTIGVLFVYGRNNERMKFFHVRSFFIPIAFYVLLYYFTPLNTVSMGIAIGLSLIYVQMVNEQCYQDMETRFFNRLYLDYLKGRIEKGTYDIESAILFRVDEGKVIQSAELITKQLPEACETIRYNKDTIVTLTHVNDRSPLFMVTEDVQMSLEEAGIPVDTKIDLKKKKESSSEFLNRFLRNAK